MAKQKKTSVKQMSWKDLNLELVNATGSRKNQIMEELKSRNK